MSNSKLPAPSSQLRPEHGLIMSGDNPRLILDGLKTQTRRLPAVNNCLVDGVHWSAKRFAMLDFASPKVFLDQGPSPAGNSGPYLHVPKKNDDDGVMHRVYPLWQSGDEFWVREKFATMLHHKISKYDLRVYCCDGEIWDGPDKAEAKHSDPPNIGKPPERWRIRPSIHMPRWASRITTEIIRVWFERLQDISEEDAWSEGCEKGEPTDNGGWFPKEQPHPKCGFVGWDSAIDWYADQWEQLHGEGSWDENPWIVAAEFAIATPAKSARESRQ